MPRFGHVFLLLGLMPSIVSAANVLSSIKPIQLITNEITQGVSTSDVLLSTNTSPHDYALKPSDIKKIKEADLVVWIGEDMETFLTGVMDNHSGAFALQEQPEIQLREYGDCGCDEDESHHSENKHHDEESNHQNGHEEHKHGVYDMHLWLGPDYALQAAIAIANRLSKIDPDNAKHYQDNLAAFKVNLNKTNAEIEAQLLPVRDNGYFVFHDAYGYFENHFKLNNLGHFTVSPERKPGAKTLNKIRKKLESEEAYCVFSEPQFTPAVVSSVTRGTSVNKGELDPLAVNIKVQSGAYFDFLKSLGSQFASCLSE
ncbi:zinc ABC transporter substrate-binding protein ZnuA [Vibrio sp. S9_S30]|uniref:zinc ABC transporter substrate-binding protein ZnuA n=1 Tax=Vibrio sp. S9_S30 TaxID=2720226 RepID=UPI0016811DB0|nr:zinc ABC transporter substrate-binding protein ZnuA [Vibrio sp. S9_S30]MBD1559105.1 zinc ABC transporter substrate-binding protein ZnuA [Vibrio sp. S9_S30]